MSQDQRYTVIISCITVLSGNVKIMVYLKKMGSYLLQPETVFQKDLVVYLGYTVTVRIILNNNCTLKRQFEKKKESWWRAA